MTASAAGSDRDQIAALYRVARALLHEGDYADLLQAVLDAAIEELHAERGFVLVRDPDGFHIAGVRQFPDESLDAVQSEVSSTIASEVVEQGHAVLVGDAKSSHRFGNRESVQRLGLKSVLCAPLISGSGLFAVLYLENRQLANVFQESDRQLLDEICRMSAPRLRTAIEASDARRRAAELETRLGESDGILTADPAFMALLQTARQVAPTDLPVLIQGETGTGKELLARSIYLHSRRSHAPLVVVNCAAIPETLIGSELFGYVRGAFTGASQDRIGFVAAANRGSLFLDEIGDMPLELQSQLLRVLQSGEYTPLGSVRVDRADIRFLAATNRDLESEIKEKRFRDDLFYRLASVILKIPPLRERPQDIPLLAARFLRQYAVKFNRETPRLSAEASELLQQYSFPGNVRELEGEIARIVATSTSDVVPASALNPRIGKKTAAGETRIPAMSLAEAERKLIQSVLEQTGGNRTRAAEVLGISREGLRLKLQRIGLPDEP